MSKVSTITLAGEKLGKQVAREGLATNYFPEHMLGRYLEEFEALMETTVGALDRKVKHGEDLSYIEAFCGMCYVIAATNARFGEMCRPMFAKAYGQELSQERLLALASAFLNLMATKESLRNITHKEVAGMVAATKMDLVITFNPGEIIETCGMGGDKGFEKDGVTYKGINVSTLSSLVLAGMGLPTVKHGSYGNTSAIGSTETIEIFGAMTSMKSLEHVTEIWKASNYCFFDAHWCKTVHDLSHLLMMETINHIIGPMTPPIDSDTTIHKVMGVNEKVHPSVITQAYALLHRKGVQRMGGVLALSGLSRDSHNVVTAYDQENIRSSAILDEVSPYLTVVSASYEDNYLGTFLMRPEHFGISIDPSRIMFPNNREHIMEANRKALLGEDPELTKYLAMNAAMGLFAAEYLAKENAVYGEVGLNRRYLRECFGRCHEAIMNGSSAAVLQNYVAVSKGLMYA